MHSTLGCWLRRMPSRVGKSPVLYPFAGLQPVAGANPVRIWGRGGQPLGVVKRKATAAIPGSHGWRVPCRFRCEPDSNPIRCPGPDHQTLGGQYRPLPEGNDWLRIPYPLSGLARGPATVPFLRQRYPSLGLGNRRLPAGVSRPPWHNSDCSLESRLPPASLGLP